MKKKSVFHTFKVGQRVRDTWYGRAIVEGVGKTYLEIRNCVTGKVWRYDRAHVNAFIVKGWKTK